jgi:hypothetical protein
MKKEKLLNALLLETGLFELAPLRDDEERLLRQYLQDNRSSEKIARKLSLPVEELEKLIRTGMKKVLLVSKEVLATKTWFMELTSENEFLQHELSTLKTRFKKELIDPELTARYNRGLFLFSNKPVIDHCHFGLGSDQV